MNFESLFDRLWPICRSLTGDGFRASLSILHDYIPLQSIEVPSGTDVFDWTIPKEWNIKEAFIETPNGERICELKQNNLHVMGYSTPIDEVMSWENLQPHLHTRPDLPNAIPYVTSYYKENWGFCLSHERYRQLPQTGQYRVKIDSSLKDGHLTYGEALLSGESDEEVLFSTYLCHPSMANNELSGPLVMADLFQRLAELKNRRLTYRFLVVPETIGTLTFLARQHEHLQDKLLAGYVMTCLGIEGPMTYKMSKQETSTADRMAMHILKHEGIEHRIEHFSVGGSDERQYCSPGLNLPVGSLMTTPYKQYPEYHTSLDDKSCISFAQIQASTDAYFKIAKGLELNQKHRGRVQMGEPMLSRHGLYPTCAGESFDREALFALLHFLSFADGKMPLLEIAEKRNQSILAFQAIVEACKTKDLIG